jgi:hypothetical protein
MTEERDTERERRQRQNDDGEQDPQVDRQEDDAEGLIPASPTPEEKPETQETGEAGPAPDDLTEDPAYEPDDETLKGIKGG